MGQERPDEAQGSAGVETIEAPQQESEQPKAEPTPEEKLYAETRPALDLEAKRREAIEAAEEWQRNRNAAKGEATTEPETAITTPEPKLETAAPKTTQKPKLTDEQDSIAKRLHLDDADRAELLGLPEAARNKAFGVLKKGLDGVSRAYGAAGSQPKAQQQTQAKPTRDPAAASSAQGSETVAPNPGQTQQQIDDLDSYVQGVREKASEQFGPEVGEFFASTVVGPLTTRLRNAEQNARMAEGLIAVQQAESFFNSQQGAKDVFGVGDHEALTPKQQELRLDVFKKAVALTATGAARSFREALRETAEGVLAKHTATKQREQIAGQVQQRANARVPMQREGATGRFIPKSPRDEGIDAINNWKRKNGLRIE